MERVALVTGASHGFGKLTAERLVKEGYRVYGTSRMQVADTNGVRMRTLELTNAATIEACVQGIVDEAHRIDLLVNNAGRFQEGILEETPMKDVELLFQTNFMGVVRVTNAVLPVMRTQRAGKMVFVGSLAGLIGLSGMGYTSAVKHALEGYAEALRLEVEGFGIHVSLVEPSYFKTDIYNRRIASGTGVAIRDYDSLRSVIEHTLEQENADGDDPVKVADVIAQIASSKAPRLRYPVGKGAALFSRLKRYMPETMFLKGMRSRLKQG